MDSAPLNHPIEPDHDPALDAAPEDEAATAVPSDKPARPERPPSIGQLRRERKRLWAERQENVYHLGGLALDLKRRELLGDPLVAKRADVITEMDLRILDLDEQLNEADERRRRGRVREPDPVGYCMSCGAPHQSEAAFCFRCGARIHVPEEDDNDTQVINMSEADGR